MFKIGDMAVYPTQGVGVIENIEVREYSGHSQNFYILRIVDSDMKIMIPVTNVSNVGMRRLIDQQRITGVLMLWPNLPAVGKLPHGAVGNGNIMIN